MQESLNNVVKHSGSTLVEVRAEFCPNRIRLSIEDNGEGFSEAIIRTGKRRCSGFGLLGMRERAVAVGGQLEIKSTIGEGTKVVIEVPLG